MGVAAVGRNYHSPQNRTEWWIDGSGNIGMPVGPGASRHRTSGKSSAVLGHRIDFGEFAIAAEHHVRGCQITEVPRKFDVLAMVEVLVSKKNDLPVKQGLAYANDLRGRERLA